MRLIILIVIALITSATSVYSQDEPVGFELTAIQQELLLGKLDRQWERLFEPELKKGASIIEVAAFALDAAAAGYRQERLETALNQIVKNINRSKRNAKLMGTFSGTMGIRKLKIPTQLSFVCDRPFQSGFYTATGCHRRPKSPYGKSSTWVWKGSKGIALNCPTPTSF